ncbi:hypothetical protein BHF71_00285 [Vulcanibacillus modesticaldus]|uniref:Flagellar hook-length control protein-like C-terminal domain-containing protein n=1 Tax=Vulcanibacillus modesticaldus TaxID=337097 RepID=A0A1D2YX88_9BACI|nr:hypothetical protein [Vulcanibacillus modesticaldus]OEG00381.1 hypothetical protein BHF71_00285 [Vulcanibacillus modesticaldus]
MFSTNLVINSFFQSSLNNGKAQLINLKPDQIIHGQVLEIIDRHHAIVSLNNSKVLTKVEVPVSKGQSFWFQVTSAGEDIKLKIVTENNSSNQPIKSLGEVLQQLKLKNTVQNRQILTEMLKINLPIDKETINTIAKLVAEDREIINILQAVRLLKDKKIEVTSANVKAVYELFENDSLLNKLSDLDKEVVKLLSNNQSLPTKTIVSLEKLHQQIAKLIEEYGYTTTVDNLQSYNGEKIDYKQIIPKLIKFIESFQNRHSSDLPNLQETSLKENLEQLFSVREVLPENLVKSLDKTVNHIVGQNLVMSPDQSDFSQMILQLPGPFPFSKNPVFIQIYSKNKKNRAIDPENMNLVFLFQLENLGDLMIKLQVLHKQLFFQVFNDNPITKEIMKEFEAEFFDFVRDNGYQTTGIRFQSFESNREQIVPSLKPPYEGVDIRV